MLGGRQALTTPSVAYPDARLVHFHAIGDGYRDGGTTCRSSVVQRGRLPVRGYDFSRVNEKRQSQARAMTINTEPTLRRRHQAER